MYTAYEHRNACCVTRCSLSKQVSFSLTLGISLPFEVYMYKLSSKVRPYQICLRHTILSLLPAAADSSWKPTAGKIQALQSASTQGKCQYLLHTCTCKIFRWAYVHVHADVHRPTLYGRLLMCSVIIKLLHGPLDITQKMIPLVLCLRLMK